MIAVDSSAIIAALLSWHEFHERAATALEKAMARKRLILPLPALLESYSVMTRLPSPYRVQASVAHELLRASFANVPVATLPAEKAWTFLADCEGTAIAGGRISDALIATIAIEAGARELITFNPRHFEAFSDRLHLPIS